ncbi:Biofilm growth-associated repressor [bacterium YEK0313]|nr:Biofilm growth-associated repressor [bacterium YEK0313]
MTGPDTQIEIFSAFAELARALASPHRLMLLEHVAQGERPVERLAALTGLSIANASQHLQQLRRAGFVQTRRNGKQVLYRLGNGPVLPLLAALRSYGEHNRSEIRALIADSFGRRDQLEAISREELVSRLMAGDVTLIDVRPEEEFRQGHLPGAVNLPLGELERRLAELSRAKEVVAYCRGPYCVLSFEAVAALRAGGFRARRFDGGFPSWKDAGLAVATDA